ncbi:MAG: hypothetical protein ACFFDS_08010 [Candidatus Thorarchaeota archaeon]
MASLTNVEIGSVVCNLVSNIPASISGTLPLLVNQSVHTAENITGNDLDVASIGESYQPGVIFLTISNVLGLMESQGIGTKSVKVGELSIMKGMNEGTSKDFERKGIKLLQDIGQKMSYYQTWS